MSTRLPSLHNLEAFLCFAEVSSLKRAAQRLNITMSAVSQRMHALEEELAARLLTRDGTRIKLNEAGRNYVAAVTPILQDMRNAMSSINAGLTATSLRISGTPAFLVHWLAPRLPKFTSQHPEAAIDLYTVGTRHAVNSDIVISPMTASAACKGATELFDIVIAPVCSREFMESARLREPADLLRVPLIEMSGVMSWPVWFAQAGLPIYGPRQTINVDVQSVLYQLAQDHVGVAMGGNYSVERFIEDGSLVRPFPLFCRLSERMALTVRAESDRPVQRAFVAWLMTELAHDAIATSTSSS